MLRAILKLAAESLVRVACEEGARTLVDVARKKLGLDTEAK